MTRRRTSMTLATIALAIAATLCASDASACSTKAEATKGCCARKARTACGCCRVDGPKSPAPAIADEPEPVALDSASCDCRAGRPAAPVDRGRPSARIESPDAPSSAIPASLDRPAATDAPRLARTIPAGGPSIYRRTSRLLL